MSIQKHNVPVGLGRFNYWALNIAVPMEVPETLTIPSDLASHEYCTTMFHRLLSAPALRQRYAAPIRALYRFRGSLPEKDDASLALAWYVANDLVWQQDATACAMIKRLPPEIQLTLINYHQDRARRLKPWSWKTLLPHLALDLTIFRFMLRKGPSVSELLSTDDPLGHTPFASLKLSTRLVREIYCSYQSYTSSLFGAPLVVNKVLLPTFNKLGYAFSNEEAFSLPIFYGLGTATCGRRRRDAVHFFSHALNNLIRYQHGRVPVTAGECHDSCWQTIKLHRRTIISKKGNCTPSAE